MRVVRRFADAVPDGGAASQGPLGFDELYDAQFAFVWRTLRRLGVRPENVADAAQDVFVVVERRRGDLRSAELARSFVYGIVVRVAHEHRRQQQKARIEEAAELPDCRARSALDQALQAEEVQLLDRLLGELDIEKREVLILVELEELTVPEVAELIGQNPNTVYSRLRAARTAFDAALMRHRARTRNGR
jgi:RNA polymerase sigma-70 factor (ECF subfamily)